MRRNNRAHRVFFRSANIRVVTTLITHASAGNLGDVEGFRIAGAAIARGRKAVFYSLDT